MAAENYLLSIFRLEEQGQHVTMTRLGDHLKTLPIDEGLGTSLPSVAAMIRRMGREGLVSSDSKKGVTLTRDGLKAAESIVRRHRLSERMVVDLLGMELERCHIEAHRLEHAISPELEEKIAARLGDVKTCPFGHPVPGTGYSPPRGRHQSGRRLRRTRLRGGPRAGGRSVASGVPGSAQCDTGPGCRHRGGGAGPRRDNDGLQRQPGGVQLRCRGHHMGLPPNFV